VGLFGGGTKRVFNFFSHRRARLRRPLKSSLVTLVSVALFAAASGYLVALNDAEAENPYRAFSPSSYWNTPLAPDAPVDGKSGRIIGFLKRKAATDFVHLAGADPTGKWGNPIYWADSDDAVYDIRNSCSYKQPSEFSSVRIPPGAKPDPTSDSAMTIYDLEKHVVYGFHRAVYKLATDTWTACGGAVYYLASNGLHGSLRRSDDDRNGGHRGVPPPTFAVRYDEVRSGAIEHMLKIAVPRTRCSHVFPMIRDECGTKKKNAPPEGARIRIQPSLDLTALDLSPQALIVARALQDYGAVIGDQSGGPVSLKLENTVAEGRGYLWNELLAADSLAPIPLESFEVIDLGFDPTHENAP
jgi:hypothetical protein